VAVTIGEMLEIVPPDVLRYLIARTRPERTIDFDPGMGLISLIDEYDRVSHEAAGREFELSRISSIPTRIPFRHMVTVVQIAHDERRLFQCLARTSYDVTNTENILRQAERARVWLRQYAPDSVKFSVKEKLPPQLGELSEGDTRSLAAYLEFLKALPAWTAEALHNGVYEVAPRRGVDAKRLFELIYLAFLGQGRGPRLGWFLEALGREFVIGRLSEAVYPCVL
jgi:lysyl-tRNA synthetase class 1